MRYRVLHRLLLHLTSTEQPRRARMAKAAFREDPSPKWWYRLGKESRRWLDEGQVAIDVRLSCDCGFATRELETQKVWHAFAVKFEGISR